MRRIIIERLDTQGYIATFEGHEDDELTGRGLTEQEAVDDLKQQTIAELKSLIAQGDKLLGRPPTP